MTVTIHRGPQWGMELQWRTHICSQAQLTQCQGKQKMNCALEHSSILLQNKCDKESLMTDKLPWGKGGCR